MTEQQHGLRFHVKYGVFDSMFLQMVSNPQFAPLGSLFLAAGQQQPTSEPMTVDLYHEDLDCVPPHPMRCRCLCVFADRRLDGLIQSDTLVFATCTDDGVKGTRHRAKTCSRLISVTAPAVHFCSPQLATGFSVSGCRRNDRTASSSFSSSSISPSSEHTATCAGTGASLPGR